MLNMIKLIECPRDAMQGIKEWIPTNKKVSYINKLLEVGFDTIDFGSFVSPKAIPQMKDTAEVLSQLILTEDSSKLLTIVANERGARDAAQHEEIKYLGYPFSISETFQLRNTNATIEESLDRVRLIQELCMKYGKEMVVYISMGFGNPYGEPWNYEIVEKWIDKLHKLGINIISISDTIGLAKKSDIELIFTNLIPKYSRIEFGSHFHTKPDQWFEKVNSAFQSGCKRFDGAILGFGGCPMAKDDLTGNLPTEKLISFFNSVGVKTNINSLNFESCYNNSLKLFSSLQD